MNACRLFFLLVAVTVFTMMGCNGSSGEAEYGETGSVAFSLKWPDQTRTAASAPAHDSGIRRLQAGEDGYSAMALSDNCDARGVETVAVIVRDGRENFLVQASFDCEAGEGVIEHVAVGEDRMFMVSGLDASGSERYHGEKTEVVIESGENDVGVIEMLNVTSAPIAVISEPADGSILSAGSDISFTGSASDGEDGDLTGQSLVWTSSINERFGTGTTVSTGNLSPGTHTITLTATDSDQRTGSHSITLTINNRPVVEIYQPEAGAVYTEGTQISFSCEASDTEDGTLGGSALVWNSDVDGRIGTGTGFSTDDLSAGTHSITLTATDSDGGTGNDSMSLIVNAPPAVSITAPENNAIFAGGSEITFSCETSDAEDGALSGSQLEWSSDVSGPIGSGTSMSTESLPAGIHTISITATDSHGAEASDSVSITVNTPNSPPEASISRPFDGSVHSENADIYFEGAATDPEDGVIEKDGLVWHSDIDGTIGFGPVFPADTLSAGTHAVTLVATDSEGAVGRDIVSITVLALRLPDTGQTQSYTETFGEDADYTIKPPAYVKLDASGNELPASANDWAMVRDRVSGLVWEVKTNDDSIHQYSDRYYLAEARDSFIGTLNKTAFGGYTDWRLPEIMELYSIVHGGYTYTAIDPTYFPNVWYEVSCYWSGTLIPDTTGQAWAVDFTDGLTCLNDSAKPVRAVRGPELTAGELVSNGDGTYTDVATGLMWATEVLDEGINWEAALDYCDSLTRAGYSDWRLPNLHELNSRFDFTSTSPFVILGFRWSSTSDFYYGTDAYVLNFDGTGAFESKTDTTRFVAAVRGGQ